MHAVLITFTTTASREDLAGPLKAYAHDLCDVEGLVAKTWIADDRTLGGFHIFTTPAAADRYLDSNMVAGLTGNPAFHGFEIRHFEILDELSRITGSPSTPLTTAGRLAG